MLSEPILIFFLLRYLRRSLRKFSPDQQWEKILNYSSFAIIILFVVGEATRAHSIIWLWDLILLTIIWITYNLPVFQKEKQVMNGVIPLVLLTIFNHICTEFFPLFYDRIDQYVNLAFGVAITWLISILIKSGKQQKALEAERKKTKEEEDHRKFIASQKDELEVLVKEE